MTQHKKNHVIYQVQSCQMHKAQLIQYVPCGAFKGRNRKVLLWPFDGSTTLYFTPSQEMLLPSPSNSVLVLVGPPIEMGSSA